MTGHGAPVQPGEHALLDQVRACVTEIASHISAEGQLPAAPPDYPEAYNRAVTSLLATRVLLYRAYSILLAVELETTVTS